ncbi:hypothetical protein IG631_09991 [Alternaria alternata]|nr:hypothetical protein IG631_09991 [Alternaria alternata]
MQKLQEQRCRGCIGKNAVTGTPGVEMRTCRSRKRIPRPEAIGSSMFAEA